MRSTFIRTLTQLAQQDSRILLLTGDLGYTVIEPFAKQFPDRFFNVGVAEQNMVGLATGLAEAGFIPFVYSISTFATLRPFEIIRNGPVLHQLPVRIIAVGGGFDYGHAGITHHALEDLGAMRLHPGMMIVAPVDHEQACQALLATWNQPGPVWYRLGKDEKNVIPGLNGRFDADQVQTLGPPAEVALLATGNIASEAVRAAELLQKQGIACRLVLVPCLQPAPVQHLAGILRETRLALTIEEHYTSGGLGSLVCEIVAEGEIACRVVRCGCAGRTNGKSGSQSFLRSQHGLSAEKLVELVHGLHKEIAR